MKISFWSPKRKVGGVTTNLACVAATMAIGQIGKSVILENHYSVNSIGDIILIPEQVEHLREHGEYYNRYGIEYVLKRLYSGEAGERLIHKASIPVLLSAMFYIPQGRIVNKEVFNYEFNQVQKELFQALEQFSDYVFIDTERNQNLSSNIILSEADLIVVNLDQNGVHLREFFENYPSIQEKAVYLIGNYHAESEWDISRICKEFHVGSDRIGIVPFNMEMAEAMERGRLLQFLNRNYYKASDYENEYLIRYLKKAGQMLRRQTVTRKRSKKGEEVSRQYTA